MQSTTSESTTNASEPIPDFITNWREIDHDALLIQEMLALTPSERLHYHRQALNGVERLRGYRAPLEFDRNPKAFVPPLG